jgi:Phospholipase_D-nuclease N-terminal/Short C-terminal domain
MTVLPMTVGNGDVLLWMLEFFFFVIWFWLLLTVFSDLFRDHELSGWWKALWIVVLVVFPYLGILVYFIVRGRGMAERSIKAQHAAQAQVDARIRDVAGSESPADQISKAKALLDAGAIDQTEFDALKTKALNG